VLNKPISIQEIKKYLEGTTARVTAKS